MVEDAACAIGLPLGRKQTLTGRRTKHFRGGVRQNESHHNTRMQCCPRSKAGHEEISRPALLFGKQRKSLQSLTYNLHLYALHCLCCETLLCTVGNFTMHLVASLRASATFCRNKNGPTSGVLFMASTTSHVMGYTEESEMPNLAATSREEPPASIRRPIARLIWMSISISTSRNAELRKSRNSSSKTVLVSTSISYVYQLRRLEVLLKHLYTGTWYV